MQQERQHEECKSCRSSMSPSTLKLVWIVESSWPFKSKVSQMSPEGATWPLEVNKREERGSDRNCLGCFLWELAGCWMMGLPEARLRVRIALWFFKFKLVLMETFFWTIIKVGFFVSIPTLSSLPEVQIPRILFCFSFSLVFDQSKVGARISPSILFWLPRGLVWKIET